MVMVGRFDHLFYGRYFEAFILPLLCTGVYLLFIGKYKAKICIINIGIILILSIDLFRYVQTRTFKPSIDMQISALSGWNITNLADIKTFYIFGVGLLAISIIIILVIL